MVDAAPLFAGPVGVALAHQLERLGARLGLTDCWALKNVFYKRRDVSTRADDGIRARPGIAASEQSWQRSD